jgi:hypothetical protein
LEGDALELEDASAELAGVVECPSMEAGADVIVAVFVEGAVVVLLNGDSLSLEDANVR